jgi:hypothetical protein
VSCCLWAAPSFAPAGPSADSPEALQPGQAATTGPLITDTTIPQPLGTANLQITSLLALRSANFSPGWRRLSAGGDFCSLTVPARLNYGLAPRTEVFAVVQYVHHWAADVSRVGSQRSADFGGLGDSNLTLKFLLLDERPSIPAIAGIFGINLPTGHHRSLNPARLGIDQLGSGSYTFTTGLNFFKVIKPVLLYANLYYNLSTDATVGGLRIHPRDFVTLNFAAEYPLSGPWVLLLELVSTWDTGRMLGPKSDQAPRALVSLLPGLEFIATDTWQLSGGILIDLVGKNTNASFTPLLAVFYNL